jgi:hypothetical protein
MAMVPDYVFVHLCCLNCSPSACCMHPDLSFTHQVGFGIGSSKLWHGSYQGLGWRDQALLKQATDVKLDEDFDDIAGDLPQALSPVNPLLTPPWVVWQGEEGSHWQWVAATRSTMTCTAEGPMRCLHEDGCRNASGVVNCGQARQCHNLSYPTPAVRAIAWCPWLSCPVKCNLHLTVNLSEAHCCMFSRSHLIATMTLGLCAMTIVHLCLEHCLGH